MTTTLTMKPNRVTDNDWYDWTNTTYNTENGRLFIQQLFRICLFWKSPRTKVGMGLSPQEMMAYDNICKQIMNGLSKENIADLLSHTRKTGDE